MGVNAFAGDYQDSLGRRSWRGLEQTLLASQGSAAPSVCESRGKNKSLLPAGQPGSVHGLSARCWCHEVPRGAMRCLEVPRGAVRCRGAEPAPCQRSEPPARLCPAPQEKSVTLLPPSLSRTFVWFPFPLCVFCLPPEFVLVPLT